MGMSKMAGQPEAQGTLLIPCFSALTWAPSGIPGQYISSLPGKRSQVSKKKKKNSRPGSVLNVFPATTSEPQTSVLSALRP